MKTNGTIVVVILLLATLASVVGCNLRSGYTYVKGPHNAQYQPSAGLGAEYWDFSEKGFVLGSDRFELSNVSFAVVGPKSVRISGKVRLVYTVGDWERCWRDNPSVGNRYHQMGRSDGGNRFVNRRVAEWFPKGVSVSVTGASGYFRVGKGGAFAGTLESKENVVFCESKFKRAAGSKYVQWRRLDLVDTPMEISVKDSPGSLKRYSPNHPNPEDDYYKYKYYPGNRAFKKRFDFSPQTWLITRDSDNATRYAVSWAMNRLCGVILDVKEQVTKQKVSPRITITPTGASSYVARSAEFRRALQTEFGGDAKLVKIGMVAGERYLRAPLGSIKSDTAQLISFVAWTGVKYKVEAVHNKYNNFRGFLKPHSSKDISKTILLVKKGDKTRGRKVAGVEGGSLVDSDD